MNLNQITDKNCPVCGSRAVSETKDRKHTNGYWNESRKYACGARMSFSPNFMETKMEKYHQCPYKAEELEKKDKRKKAKDQLTRYIKRSLKVNKEFKNALVQEINAFFKFRIY